MGKASRRKRLKLGKTNPPSNFFDYLLNPNSASDLLPLTDELIEKLVTESKIPKDDLIDMSQRGFLYSVSRNSFILPDMG